MSHIFDSKLHQSEFYVYENYVVYLHVYHVRSCCPTPTYKQPLYGCQPDEPQASLATTNRCNHVYVVLFFILLFMYAVIHCLYSVGNKITTTIFLPDPMNYPWQPIASPVSSYIWSAAIWRWRDLWSSVIKSTWVNTCSSNHFRGPWTNRNIFLLKIKYTFYLKMKILSKSVFKYERNGYFVTKNRPRFCVF